MREGEDELAVNLFMIDERLLYISVRGLGEMLSFDIEQDGGLNLKQKVLVEERIVWRKMQ